MVAGLVHADLLLLFPRLRLHQPYFYRSCALGRVALVRGTETRTLSARLRIKPVFRVIKVVPGVHRLA